MVKEICFLEYLYLNVLSEAMFKCSKTGCQVRVFRTIGPVVLKNVFNSCNAFILKAKFFNGFALSRIFILVNDLHIAILS